MKLKIQIIPKTILIMMSFTMPSESFFAQTHSNGSWSIDSINTASGVSYLSDIEKEVILEINKVRNNPVQYTELYLKPLVQFYEGLYFRYPGQIPVVTAEGKSALLDCIDALEESEPSGLLYPSEGLTKASELLQIEQSKTGGLGHTGADGSNPFDRMRQFGKWEYTAAENVDYGNNTARWIVLSLLVDDGVPGRGHRKNLLNSRFQKIGIAFGSHPEYGSMCVMDIAGEFVEK